MRAAIGAALQEAALDPLLTGRDHMRLQTTLQGLPKRERRARGDELLARVGPRRRRRSQGRRLLGRDEAPARPRARARALPARAVPRRADDGPGPLQPRRPVGRGRAARARGRRDRVPDHAVPRGGRRARRPRRHHRPRPHRRRGHAGGAEGGDRAPVGRGDAGRSRASATRSPRVLASSARRSPRRPASPPCGSRRRGPDAVVRALDAERPRASPTCSSTSRRSTTSSSPRPAASSTPATSRRPEPRAGRGVSLLAQSGEMARRSVLQTLRQPAMVIPPILFPLILMAINVGGLDAATLLPGFPTDNYLDFAIAFPFIQGSLFASINAGIEPRARRRDRLPQAARADADAALRAADRQPRGRDGGGAARRRDLPRGRLRRRPARRGRARPACW